MSLDTDDDDSHLLIVATASNSNRHATEVTISSSAKNHNLRVGEAANPSNGHRAHEVLSHGQIAAIVVVALLILCALTVLGLLSCYYRRPRQQGDTGQTRAPRPQSEEDNTSRGRRSPVESPGVDASFPAAPPSNRYKTVRRTSGNPEQPPRPF